MAEPEDDDDEEHFVDAPDSDAEDAAPKTEAAPAKKWDTTYDGKKREPQYAHAENSCLWELVRSLRLPFPPTTRCVAR